MNRRICIRCQLGRGRGRGHGHGTFNGFDQDLYDDLSACIRAEMETLHSPASGDYQRSLFRPDNQPTPPDLQPTLHTSDLSTLPMGPPTTIPTSHRGTLSPFLARQRENEYAFDASRDLHHTLARSATARAAVEDLLNGPFGPRLASLLSSQSRQENHTGINPSQQARRTSAPSFTDRHRIFRNARQIFHVATANYAAAINQLVPRQDPDPTSGPSSASLLHASDMPVEGDEQGDGTALGRFFANADITQPEDAQYGPHVSDNDPDEPPRQRRRLNPTGEEEAMNGTGESSS